MTRTAAPTALALLALFATGCAAEGSTGGGAEASAGGEAPALVVPDDALEMMPAGMHVVVHVDGEALRSSGIMGLLVNEARESEDLDEGERAAIDYFAAQSDAFLCGLRYDPSADGLPFACVLSGRFAGWSLVGSLLALDDGEVRTDAHGFTVLAEGGTALDDPSVLVLDDRYILLGHPHFLEEVFAAMADPADRLTAQRDFQALAEAGGFGQHAASLLGIVPESLREAFTEGSTEDRASAFLAQVAAQLQGVTARVDIGDLTEITVALHAQTPASAADLASLVGLVLRVAATSGDDPEVAELLARVEVGVESTQVMLRWVAPTSEVIARLADVADKQDGGSGSAPESP